MVHYFCPPLRPLPAGVWVAPTPQPPQCDAALQVSPEEQPEVAIGSRQIAENRKKIDEIQFRTNFGLISFGVFNILFTRFGILGWIRSGHGIPKQCVNYRFLVFVFVLESVL